MKVNRIEYTAPKARKSETFTVYPFTEDCVKISLQSPTRFMIVNLEDNTLTYSKRVSSGAYAIHTLTAMGAKVIELPESIKNELASIKSSPDKSVILFE